MFCDSTIIQMFNWKSFVILFQCDEVYIEAQVQNITSGPISLENVSLEASPGYKGK